MSEEYKWGIVREYLEFIDENYILNLVNGNIYEPHDTIRIHVDDESFLIVESGKFVEQFNNWIYTKPDYMKYLQENTNWDCPNDNSWWLDYLTGDMWGYECEYGVCDVCGKALRTSPNSYHWQPYYWINTDIGYRECGDCVKEDPSDYLEMLTNNPNHCNVILNDGELEKLGYTKINLDSYESGWYGRADKPALILHDFQVHFPEREFIFHLDGNSQFCVRFSLYYKDEEATEEVA